jgi:hypothetical protein
MDCALCGEKLCARDMYSETLVGHVKKIYKRRACAVPGCGWKGKQTYCCHFGLEVVEWP